MPDLWPNYGPLQSSPSAATMPPPDAMDMATEIAMSARRITMGLYQRSSDIGFDLLFRLNMSFFGGILSVLPD